MTLLAAMVAWTAAHLAPLITLTRCVSADRPVAWLGLHLAVLHQDAGCGPGRYALDAGPGHGVGLVVMVAVPTLLMNLGAVLGAVGFGVMVRTALGAVAEAARRLWPRPPEPPRPLPDGCPPAPPQQPAQHPFRAWQLDRCPVLRRGPPIRVALIPALHG